MKNLKYKPRKLSIPTPKENDKGTTVENSKITQKVVSNNVEVKKQKTTKTTVDRKPQVTSLDFLQNKDYHQMLLDIQRMQTEDLNKPVLISTRVKPKIYNEFKDQCARLRLKMIDVINITLKDKLEELRKL